MKKSQEYALRKVCGDPTILCGIRDYIYNEGPARGMRAFDLRNGKGLEMTVLADRGLDIPYCTFKGVNVALLNKVGLRSQHLYQEDLFKGFLRQFYGGLLTTGGLCYAGAAGEDEGRQLGLHGSFDNTPAERVLAYSDTEGDDVVLRVHGEIRDSEVFRENLVMHRTLSLETESNRLHICDEVENQGYMPSPLMLVYHINFGYPLLADGAMIYTNAGKVVPRDPIAAEGFHKYDRMEEPEAGREEEAFFHTEQPAEGAFAMVHNEALGMAVIIHYDPALFPLLCEWKCMRAGDYALGLEPTTSGVTNRSVARENGMLTHLDPGERRRFHITMEFTDDASVIESYKARAHKE